MLDLFQFSADHVSIELSDLLWFLYCLILNKCEMFSLKSIICVWSSMDRKFFKCVNQSSAISVSRLIITSSVSLFLFDLVFRTTATLRDWKARWPFRNMYCYFFFSKWMPPEIGTGRVLHVVEFLVNFRMRCWCSTTRLLITNESLWKKVTRWWNWSHFKLGR